MHRVYDFAADVRRLPYPEQEQLEVAAAEHRESGFVVSGIITDIRPDAFTLAHEDGTTSEWPLHGYLGDYRRGTRCSVVVNEDAVIGLGPLHALTYVTLPELVEIWVESRGAVSA